MTISTKVAAWGRERIQLQSGNRAIFSGDSGNVDGSSALSNAVLRFALQKNAEYADKIDEATVADIRQLRRPTIGTDRETNPEARQSYSSVTGRDQERFCAYNQTGERFISNEVEVVDLSATALEGRFSALIPGSGAAVWIVPFRNLSPTSFRFPVDLVYLDRRCVVLEAVESFPISRVSPAAAAAASVLVLPAQTIASVGIQPGDQLAVCSPKEMAEHLRQLQTVQAEVETKPVLIHGQGTESEVELPVCNDISQLPRGEDHFQKKPARKNASLKHATHHASRSEESLPAVSAERPAPKEAATPKNWWQRLLSDDPRDPRSVRRESLPGLAAYFFTGGTPVAHEVRNISTRGLYVLTQERWYRNTIVRITLTDRHDPTAERSITLNARVARWTEDGVGFQFIMERKKDRLSGRASAVDHLPGGSDVKQLERFIKCLKGSV